MLEVVQGLGDQKKDYRYVIVRAAAVAQIERILNGSWAALARKDGLDPSIGDSNGCKQVASRAWARLGLKARSKLGAPLVSAACNPENKLDINPDKPPAPVSGYPRNSITASVHSLQKDLIKLGQRAPGTALTDGMYGPTTARAWQAEADKRGLDRYIKRVTSTTARVNINTMQALDAAAQKAPEPAPLPAPPRPPPGPVILPPAPIPGPVILPPDPGPYDPGPLPVVQAGFKLNPIMLAGAGLVALALLAMSKGKG
ncbi:MAG: hypothetical protein GY772_29330 [bacterium]|nr:hypothetical protein [bacterium]